MLTLLLRAMRLKTAFAWFECCIRANETGGNAFTLSKHCTHLPASVQMGNHAPAFVRDVFIHCNMHIRQQLVRFRSRKEKSNCGLIAACSGFCLKPDARAQHTVKVRQMGGKNSAGGRRATAKVQPSRSRSFCCAASGCYAQVAFPAGVMRPRLMRRLTISPRRDRLAAKSRKLKYRFGFCGFGLCCGRLPQTNRTNRTNGDTGQTKIYG